MRALLTALVAVAFAGCGGFDNRVLTQGQLALRVATHELEPGKAWVALPSRGLVAPISDAGVALLGELEPGAVDVVVMASREAGAFLRTTVRARETVDLGTLALSRAQRIRVELDTEGEPNLAQTTGLLRGLPLAEVHAEDDGDLELGPVPPGCYELELRVPGYGQLSANGCTATDGGSPSRVALPQPNGQAGREGCVVTGCRDGRRCGSRFVCE